MIRIPFFDLNDEDENRLLGLIADAVYAENGWEAGAIGSGPWDPDEVTASARTSVSPEDSA